MIKFYDDTIFHDGFEHRLCRKHTSAPLSHKYTAFMDGLAVHFAMSIFYYIILFFYVNHEILDIFQRTVSGDLDIPATAASVTALVDSH